MTGAELVRKLRDTGTPDTKLAVARDVLHKARKRGRAADADQVLAAIEKAYGPDHGTTVKAREIAETGVYSGPKAGGVVAIEDEILAEGDPVEKVPEDEAEAPKPGKKPPAAPAKKPAPGKKSTPAPAKRAAGKGGKPSPVTPSGLADFDGVEPAAEGDEPDEGGEAGESDPPAA